MTSAGFLDIIVGALSLTVAGMCGVRLAGMHFRTHRAGVLLAHAGIGVACLSTMEASWLASSPLMSALGRIGLAIGAAAWVWESLPEWAAGPPRSSETRPGDLDMPTPSERPRSHV